MSVPPITLLTMIIDCDTCTVREIACRDCVVSVLIGAPSEAPALDGEAARVIDLLASRGMLPPLRFAEPEANSRHSQQERRSSV